MRSASVILGLAVGCLIAATTGYWSNEQLHKAPVITFPWVHTFSLSVDGTLVLPLIIMFACQAVSCTSSSESRDKCYFKEYAKIVIQAFPTF
jgi:xanthine/uracil permease